LQKAPGGYTHLLVAIDKFSKWVEVRPITNLRAEQAVIFFIDIIYRCGVPNSIITDNGSQFTGKKFLEFCDKHHILVDWAAVAHPQTNGQVERANGMIRPQAQDFRQTEQAWPKMAQGAAGGRVEP
jgi:transposase InsO family protein